jgi:hypothetical protein
MMKKVLLAIATLSFVPGAVMADPGASIILGDAQSQEDFAKFAHFAPNAKLVDLKDIKNVKLPRSSSSDDLTEDESRQVASGASAAQAETGIFATVKSWFSRAYAFVASYF